MVISYKIIIIVITMTFSLEVFFGGCAVFTVLPFWIFPFLTFTQPISEAMIVIFLYLNLIVTTIYKWEVYSLLCARTTSASICGGVNEMAIAENQHTRDVRRIQKEVDQIRTSKFLISITSSFWIHKHVHFAFFTV